MPATDAGTPPELIEKKLVDESKRAGVPAYQFDPDASPEKKAEQARMVCLSFVSFKTAG